MRTASLFLMTLLCTRLTACKKRDETAPSPDPTPKEVASDSGPKQTPTLPTPSGTNVMPLSSQSIGKAAGTEAQLMEDGVVRIGWSRTDVAVKVDGMPFPPAAGLGSWAAFKAIGDGAMVMGDTVVFQDEVDVAMDAAFTHGLHVTALHNHFFFDEPKVYFMHIGGKGDALQLAQGVKAVWDAIKGVRALAKFPAMQFPGGTPKAGTIDATAIEKVIGHPAKTKKGGVVKVGISRDGTMHSVGLASTMGLSSWAAFSGSDELASIDGDFIMTENEVQPVLLAMRDAGFHIVALHNHMVGGEPFFYFTHYWGKGKAVELAQGFKSVLDAQAQVKGN